MNHKLSDVSEAGDVQMRIAFSVESLNLTKGIAFPGVYASAKVRVVQVEE